MTVVEPGGLRLYKRAVHEALLRSPLGTPEGWKQRVFVEILKQELRGGEFKYDPDSLEAMSLIED
jgi:hypothetical protein